MRPQADKQGQPSHSLFRVQACFIEGQGSVVEKDGADGHFTWYVTSLVAELGRAHLGDKGVHRWMERRETALGLLRMRMAGQECYFFLKFPDFPLGLPYSVPNTEVLLIDLP